MDNILDKAVPYILSVGVIILVILFINMNYNTSPDDIEFIQTDYGCYNLSNELSFIDKPEPYGVMFLVIYSFDNSAPVYRYFDEKEDAWTFYSIIRMTYVGGKHAEPSSHCNP